MYTHIHNLPKKHSKLCPNHPEVFAGGKRRSIRKGRIYIDMHILLSWNHPQARKSNCLMLQFKGPFRTTVRKHWNLCSIPSANPVIMLLNNFTALTFYLNYICWPASTASTGLSQTYISMYIWHVPTWKLFTDRTGSRNHIIELCQVEWLQGANLWVNKQ